MLHRRSSLTVQLSVKRFDYGSDFRLQDIDLHLLGPAVVALVGPNGSGKSTLLRIAGGLLRGAAHSVSIGGQSLEGLSAREVARLVSWVPQRAEAVFAMSVREMVRVGRYRVHRLLRPPGAEEEAVIERAMGEVDLLPFADRDAETLSGGEWQRALIARAVAQDAPVMLLDEPVASLDLRYQEDVYALLRRLAASGRLVVVADHHLELAAFYADRMLVLHGGRVVADGAPGSVLTSEQIADVFGIRVQVFPDPVTGSPRLSIPQRSE